LIPEVYTETNDSEPYGEAGIGYINICGHLKHAYVISRLDISTRARRQEPSWDKKPSGISVPLFLDEGQRLKIGHENWCFQVLPEWGLILQILASKKSTHDRGLQKKKKTHARAMGSGFGEHDKEVEWFIIMTSKQSRLYKSGKI